MAKNAERCFEALDFGKAKKAKLTAKQYLVYAYLMSISKFNANGEHHYYVYKNSFQVTKVSKFLGMSYNTWQSAIQTLIRYRYIDDFGEYFIISIPNSYAPLDIKLIKLLVNYGAFIKNGGRIVSVYSLIYKYWKSKTQNKDEKCMITASQISIIFSGDKRKDEIFGYRLMLALFKFLKLIDISEHEENFCGKIYSTYLIKNVRLNLPKEIEDKEEYDNVEEIVEALTNSLE